MEKNQAIEYMYQEKTYELADMLYSTLHELLPIHCFMNINEIDEERVSDEQSFKHKIMREANNKFARQMFNGFGNNHMEKCIEILSLALKKDFDCTKTMIYHSLEAYLKKKVTLHEKSPAFFKGNSQSYEEEKKSEDGEYFDTAPSDITDPGKFIAPSNRRAAMVKTTPK